VATLHNGLGIAGRNLFVCVEFGLRVPSLGLSPPPSLSPSRSPFPSLFVVCLTLPATAPLSLTHTHSLSLSLCIPLSLSQRTHSSVTAREKELISTRVQKYARDVDRACVDAYHVLVPARLYYVGGTELHNHQQQIIEPKPLRLSHSLPSKYLVYQPQEHSLLSSLFPAQDPIPLRQYKLHERPSMSARIKKL